MEKERADLNLFVYSPRLWLQFALQRQTAKLLDLIEEYLMIRAHITFFVLVAHN